MAWLQKRGNVYWIGWRHGGKQFRRSTGKTTKDEAESELAKLNALEMARASDALTEEFFATVTGRTVKRQRLDEFLKQWLVEAKGSVTPHSYDKYQHVIGEFSDFVQAESTGLVLQDVTQDHVARYLGQKRSKCTLATVKGFRRILGAVFLRAQNLGLVRGNPVALAKLPATRDEETSEKRPFTLAEVRDLHSRADAFWAYMIMAGFFTGQSLGDLVTLKRANVDLRENVLRLARRKSNTRVIVPLATPLRELLLKIWPKNESDFFWPTQAGRYLNCGASSFSQEFYELLTSAGLVTPRNLDKKQHGKGRTVKRVMSGLGFHNLRHTFVTNLKNNGAVDSVAKELAGHRSTAVSTRYTHLPVETLAKAINSLPTFDGPPDDAKRQQQK